MKYLKFIFLIAIYLPLNTCVYSQHQADRWYFGMNAGINFTNGAPYAIPGAITTTEGTTSASDSLGNLLFYSDGMSVWDKNGTTMPNGTGLFGNISSTVSALAVPHPGNGNLHYIFTADEAMSSNGICYSVVDMSLQNGNGDVTLKNIPLLASATEKISAVHQLGTANIWVTVHEWGTDAFYSYLVTPAGLQTTPVISNAGMVHTIDPLEQNKYGQMKFNSCGTQLALAIGYTDTVQVLDFDPATGIFSNPITLPMGDHVYGVEFSHNGDMLYVTSYNTGAGYGILSQFDLTSGVEATINASNVTIANNGSGISFYYALQLASDQKIYVCTSWSPFLGVISQPEVQGTGCNYVDMGFDLDPTFTGATAALGLPAFVQSLFRGEVNCSTVSVNEIHGDEFNVFPTVSSGYFHVTGKYMQDTQLNIYDQAGRMVENATWSGGDLIFGERLASGVYTLRVGLQSFRIVKL